jgi:HEAT repeat protein
MESNLSLKALLEKLNSSDTEERASGWLRAPEVGPSAIRPLAALMAETAPIVSRLAKELARLEISGHDPETRARIAAKQEELRGPMEAGRAAKRAVWQIVRHAEHEGPEPLRQAVVQELLTLLDERQSVGIRREAVWMLAEIAGDDAVEPIAVLLSHPELREESRQALERTPGMKSLAALQVAMATAPEDFQVRIAQSLRARGIEVPGVPGADLVSLSAK